MGKYIAESLCIASIYPGPKDAISLPFGPSMHRAKGTSTRYALQPVAKGKKPFVLEVTDMFQHYKDPLKSATQGHIAYAMDPVSCQEIADNLLRVWSKDIPELPDGAFPGIMQIVGTVPTQDELAEMKDGLLAYMEFYFLQGEQFAKENPKWIGREHRLAAEYLDKPRGWSHASRVLDNVSCPACRTSIPNDAYVCQNCGTKLKELPAELAALNTPVPVL